MAFAPVFGRVFSPTFDRRAAVAAAPAAWWEVAGKTCVAAYQPKGAASLAASYVNLANPGTYDAAPGTAPSWAAGTGWAFNGSDQVLTTGITPAGNQTWSMLVVCASGHVAVGLVSGNLAKFLLWTRTDYGGQRIASNGAGDYGWIGGLPSAPFTFGFAGRDAYYNGTDEGDIPDEADTTYLEAVTIGVVNTQPWWAAGTISAIAIYSDTLTAGEVATVSAAMAAL